MGPPAPGRQSIRSAPTPSDSTVPSAKNSRGAEPGDLSCSPAGRPLDSPARPGSQPRPPGEPHGYLAPSTQHKVQGTECTARPSDHPVGCGRCRGQYGPSRRAVHWPAHAPQTPLGHPPAPGATEHCSLFKRPERSCSRPTTGPWESGPPLARPTDPARCRLSAEACWLTDVESRVAAAGAPWLAGGQVSRGRPPVGGQPTPASARSTPSTTPPAPALPPASQPLSNPPLACLPASNFALSTKYLVPSTKYQAPPRLSAGRSLVRTWVIAVTPCYT